MIYSFHLIHFPSAAGTIDAAEIQRKEETLKELLRIACEGRNSMKEGPNKLNTKGKMESEEYLMEWKGVEKNSEGQGKRVWGRGRREGRE